MHIENLLFSMLLPMNQQLLSYNSLYMLDYPDKRQGARYKPYSFSKDQTAKQEARKGTNDAHSSGGPDVAQRQRTMSPSVSATGILHVCVEPTDNILIDDIEVDGGVLYVPRIILPFISYLLF